MARPSGTAAGNSRVKTKQASDSGESSSDGASDGQVVLSAEEDDSDDALAVTKKQKGSKSNGKKRVVDSEDENESDGDSDEDSQNRKVAPTRSGKGQVNNISRTDNLPNGAGKKKSNGKKTLNDIPALPLQPSSSAPRSPFRTVSLNDASPGAQKRRLSNSKVSRADALRRQSLPSSLRNQADAVDPDASFASNASSSADVSSRRGSGAGGNTTLAKHALAQAQLRRTSAGYALQGGGVGALNAAAALKRHAAGASAATSLNPDDFNDFTVQLPKLTREVMDTNYEEWMKLATDNKINSSNTWSFALIDYFHDMSLLRNADGDGSINFQKASCTLDGCVKIWTSRVDSVATETGKLLNGLSGDAAARAEEGSDDDEDGEGDGDADENGERRPKKKKTRTHVATLADSFSKIQVKELDLEFTVDPLFKKTSADFDEGGAAGLLMNHLGSDSTMRVVFDAGDAKVDDGEEDNQEEDDDGLDDDEKLPNVDISKLRSAFLPDLNVLDGMTICPSFATFKFNADPTLLDLSLLQSEQLEASTSGPRHTPEQEAFVDGDPQLGPMDGNGGAPVDFFDDNAAGFGGENDGYADDDAGGGFEPAYGDADGSNEDMAVDAAEAAQGAHYGAVRPFDPRMAPDEREVVIGMGGEEGEKKVFSYFDTNMSRNWAGPEHWKMRRTVRRYEKEKEEEEAANAAADKKTRTRKTKEAFSISLAVTEDTEGLDSKTLFASSRAALNIPSASTSKRKRGTMVNKKEDYLLPDDKHFASQQLLTLFRKPKAAVNMKRRVQRIAPPPGAEVDENYWAAAAAAQAGTNAGMDEDDDDYGPILPFDTQFFHDDADTPDFDDDLPMGGDDFEVGIGGAADGEGAATSGTAGNDEEDDLLKATQGQVKRARPVFVNYARRAKRVDVRKLKENIWRELALEIPVAADPEESGTDVPVPTKDFTSVISGLRKAYPEDKMEEISTSFCFICLLHLANEEGLRIQSGDVVQEAVRATRAERADRPSTSRQGASIAEDDDVVLQELRSVGGLEKLKIRKLLMA